MSKTDVVDAGDIAFACWAVRKIDEAGLLRDFKTTLAAELRELDLRQKGIWGRDDGTGRYVAGLLGADVARCEAISLEGMVGTRQSVVIKELRLYLDMIRQRAEREAQKNRMVEQYFAECEAELHGDSWAAPLPVEHEAEPAPPETTDQDQIRIHSAEQVPVSVRLAQAKAKRKRA